MKYNKLVRDNIPEILKVNGKTAITHTADLREYGKKLDEKLKEEIDEFLFAKSEEELADVYEVIDALVVFRQLDTEKIKSIKNEKAAKRGRFDKRIILDEVI